MNRESNNIIASLKSYLNIYINFLNNNIDSNKLIIFRDMLKDIPKEVINYLEYFAKLDIEYNNNTNKLNTNNFILFSPKYFINKKWIGFWLKATGIDANLYLNWLYAAMTYDKYKDKNIEYMYLEEHPREKHVPYSIKIANEIYKKYYS